MSQYSEILANLKSGICNYGNERTGVCYSIGATNMKIKTDGSLQFFSTVEQMARSINKFLKTGY